MFHWILAITISLIIGGAITNLSKSVDDTDWPSWVKTLAKTFIWITAIIGTVIIAAIFALFSATPSKHEE